jgi:hypothetical protein
MGGIFGRKEQEVAYGDRLGVVIIKGIRVVRWMDVEHGNRRWGDRPCDAGAGAKCGDEAECGSCGQEALQ